MGAAEKKLEAAVMHAYGEIVCAGAIMLKSAVVLSTPGLDDHSGNSHRSAHQSCHPSVNCLFSQLHSTRAKIESVCFWLSEPAILKYIILQPLSILQQRAWSNFISPWIFQNFFCDSDYQRYNDLFCALEASNPSPVCVILAFINSVIVIAIQTCTPGQS